MAEIRTVHSKNASSTKREEGRTGTTGTLYESARTIMPTKYAGDATHTSEIDTATDRYSNQTSMCDRPDCLDFFFLLRIRYIGLTDDDLLFFRDARAILERNIKLNEEGTVDDKLYRGQSGYKNFIKKDASQVGANKHTG